MRSFSLGFSTMLVCALGYSGSLMGNGSTWNNLTNANGTIFVIRHGEKNDAGNHLSERGQMRAQFVKSLWGHHGRFPSPKRIFANFYNGEYNSVELVEPLAKSLGLPVNSSFNRGDNFRAAGAMIADLSMESSPILVAWEHKHIVRLLVDMGCGRPWLEKWWSTNWPKTDFDEIFIITFVNGTCLNLGMTREYFSLDVKQEIDPFMLLFLLPLFLAAAIAALKKKQQKPKLVTGHDDSDSSVDCPLLGTKDYP